MMIRKLKAEKEKTGFMRNDHCGIVHQVEPRLCDLERHDGPSFPVGPSFPFFLSLPLAFVSS